MCSANNFFWNQLEKELSIEIPSHIKHGLNLAQFGNPFTFKLLDDSDIKDIETVIRHKMHSKIERDLPDKVSGAAVADDVLIDNDVMIEYYGEANYKDPQNFEFPPGDLKQIKHLVKHVQANVDSNGFNKGFGRYQQKVKANSRRKLTLKQPNNQENCTSLETDAIDDIEVFDPELLIQLQSALFTKMLRCMRSYCVNDVSLDDVSQNVVSVSTIGDRIYGQIDCIICQNDSNKTKTKPKKVSYQNGGWILSNFITHLQKAHKLFKTNRSNEIENQNIGDRNSNSDQIADVKMEFLDVVVVKEDMQQKWYEQISAQITKMVQKALHNDEQQSEMLINLTESGQKRISVVSSTADGNCMFTSLTHQLFDFKMNSAQLKSAQKKLRAEVVNHIQNNYDSYTHELKGHVYDRRDAMRKNGELDSNSQEFNIDNECLFFLNHVLPKNRCWGGAETLKAVSNIYNVNIVVFFEEESCRIINNQFHDKTICIAYRIDRNEEREMVRNHYDSVSDIESSVIFDSVQQIIKQ